MTKTIAAAARYIDWAFLIIMSILVIAGLAATWAFVALLFA